MFAPRPVRCDERAPAQNDEDTCALHDEDDGALCVDADGERARGRGARAAQDRADADGARGEHAELGVERKVGGEGELGVLESGGGVDVLDGGGDEAAVDVHGGGGWRGCSVLEEAAGVLGSLVDVVFLCRLRHLRGMRRRGDLVDGEVREDVREEVVALEHEAEGRGVVERAADAREHERVREAVFVRPRGDVAGERVHGVVEVLCVGGGVRCIGVRAGVGRVHVEREVEDERDVLAGEGVAHGRVRRRGGVGGGGGRRERRLAERLADVRRVARPEARARAVRAGVRGEHSEGRREESAVHALVFEGERGEGGARDAERERPGAVLDDGLALHDAEEHRAHVEDEGVVAEVVGEGCEARGVGRDAQVVWDREDGRGARRGWERGVDGTRAVADGAREGRPRGVLESGEDLVAGEHRT